MSRPGHRGGHFARRRPVQKPAPGPPPTNVCQVPQSSTTVNGTVVAWPGAARWTVKSTLLLLAGTATVWSLATGWPATLTLAFRIVPKRRLRSGFGCRVLSGDAWTWAVSMPPLIAVVTLI